MTKTEFRLDEEVKLNVYLRIADDQPNPVRVASSGVLRDLYSVVVTTLSGRKVKMKPEGLRMADPALSFGVQGAVMKGGMEKIDEIPVSDWWDVSQPDTYVLQLSRRQPLPLNRGYVILTVPTVRFRVRP